MIVRLVDIIQHIRQQVLRHGEGLQSIRDLLDYRILLYPNDLVLVGGIAHHQIDVLLLLKRTGGFAPRCGARHKPAQQERMAGDPDGLLRHPRMTFALFTGLKHPWLDQLGIGMRIKITLDPHQAAVERVAQNVGHGLDSQRLALSGQQSPFS
ncbi:MAG: hypothetical protein PHW63_10345 [Alphaproteobacteria bacterium]|nr:hypothetical protein [Alphaproteobacteria bacterium]